MNENETAQRYKLYCQMIEQFDEGTRLTSAYDSVPHNYGAATLYQAESQIIHRVGRQPGITASELAALFRKTPSACSQLVRKLRAKGWLHQVRNTDNNREYQLFLTETGEQIYLDHARFESRCYKRSFHSLDGFSEAEFETYIAIQKKLNETFALDVAESQEGQLG